jgi:hypothetical protein
MRSYVYVIVTLYVADYIQEELGYSAVEYHKDTSKDTAKAQE